MGSIASLFEVCSQNTTPLDSDVYVQYCEGLLSSITCVSVSLLFARALESQLLRLWGKKRK